MLGHDRSLGGRPPFVVPLCLATTVVLPCRNRHLVLPQRTSRLPTREIGCVPASITHPPASITHPPASISIPQHPSPILQHPSPILQHPSASISMHHASSITQHASSISHRWGVKKIMIFHFFENVRGALEMTARLGKGLREGSRAEPGHRRAEYAHLP